VRVPVWVLMHDYLAHLCDCPDPNGNENKPDERFRKFRKYLNLHERSKHNAQRSNKEHARRMTETPAESHTQTGDGSPDRQRGHRNEVVWTRNYVQQTGQRTRQ
jgi:hypothetical protein